MRDNDSLIGNVSNVVEEKQEVIREEVNIVDPDFLENTYFVDLPTKGLDYPPESILHGVDKIEMKSMTLDDEGIFSNREYIKQGVMFEKLFSKLIVDKRISYSDLLNTDRDVILYHIRLDSFGEEMEAKIKCPSCDTTQLKKIDLKESVEKYYDELQDWEENLKEMGIERMSEGRYKFVIEDIVFVLKMANAKAMDRLVFKTKNKTNTTQIIDSIIVSINGITGSEKTNLIGKLRSNIARKMRARITLINRSLSAIRTIFECKECDYMEEMEVPVGAEFFHG